MSTYLWPTARFSNCIFSGIQTIRARVVRAVSQPDNLLPSISLSPPLLSQETLAQTGPRPLGLILIEIRHGYFQAFIFSLCFRVFIFTNTQHAHSFTLFSRSVQGTPVFFSRMLFENVHVTVLRGLYRRWRYSKRRFGPWVVKWPANGACLKRQCIRFVCMCVCVDVYVCVHR